MRILRRIDQAHARAGAGGTSPAAARADGCAFALAARLEPGRVSGFVLVCPADGEVPPEFRAIPPARVATIQHGRSPGVALALIELADFDDPLLSASVACALEAAHGHRDAAVCGWLFSHGKGREAIRGLQRAMEYTVQETVGRYPLSAHRSRRALHMPTLLDPAQWALLRTGVSDWAVPDWHGRLTWLPPAEDVSSAVPSLRLRPAQHAQAQRLDAVNATLASIVRQGGRVDLETAQRADALVERFDRDYATGYTHDRILFAVHGLQVHPRFDEHPAVAAALRGASGPYGIATALNGLDAEAWARITAELDTLPPRD